MDLSQKVEASKVKNLDRSYMFFSSKARQTFTKLRLKFIKTPILNHFNPELHIHIETDAPDYAIAETFSQLTLVIWVNDIR